FEGRSVAIDEAMLLAKPIILTNYPTAKDQIENNETGLICDISAESVFHAVVRLIENEKIRKNLTKNLQEFNLPVEKSMNKFYSLVEEIQGKNFIIRKEVISLLIKKVSYKFIFISMGLLSIIITLFGAPYTSNNYQYMLPISYTLAYIILAPSINKLSWGYFTLNIIWLIRYVVSPVMYTITDFSMSQVGEDYLLIALFVMILEL